MKADPVSPGRDPASDNSTIDLLLSRRSIRDYADRPIPDEVKDLVIAATMRAPTAGNMMLYHVIEVEDPVRREALSHSCDEQPFIAKAPWVLVFLADYKRWYDYFVESGAADGAFEASRGRSTATRARGVPEPAEGDLLLAACDALIAAQTAAIAAESLGLGSCYIGDIMERWEFHRDFFSLPRWTFPIAMLTIGWPTESQRTMARVGRFDRRFVVSKERYRPIVPSEYRELFGTDPMDGRPLLPGAKNHGQHIWIKKFSNEFMDEMRRSVRAALVDWTGGRSPT